MPGGLGQAVQWGGPQICRLLWGEALGYAWHALVPRAGALLGGPLQGAVEEGGVAVLWGALLAKGAAISLARFSPPTPATSLGWHC